MEIGLATANCLGANVSDSQLDNVLAAYLQAAERGQPPDEEALLRQYPQLAGDLKSFFANRRGMHQWAAALDEQRLPTTGAADAMAPQAGDGPPFREFGDYELEGELARGGMGVVYRARQRSLQRAVALKMVLAGRAAAPVDLARFQQEAEAAARLAHPNIVPIYEVGEHEGWSYYTMKLVEGGNLNQHLARLRGNPRAAAGLLERVARAVHFAHQHGILHRDLKPANVLIDENGDPHVTDFGLARILDSHERMTGTGAAVGTPGYMAPEQIRGERSLTVAVDVYGLGAVLYASLTGQPPFRGANAWEACQQTLESDAPSPRASNPLVDRELAIICRKALEREPSRRYESAAALADDLARWLAHKPILAQPPSVVRRFAKWTRRHPVWTAILATLALTLIVALLQSRMTWLALDGQSRARYRTFLSLADGEFSAGDVSAASQALLQCPERHRGWEWVYARRLCLTTPVNAIGPFDAPLLGGGISGDGRRLCAVDDARNVRVWDATGRELLSLTVRMEESPPQAALSRDGQRLILATHRRVRSIDVASQREVWSQDVEGIPVKLAVSRDGSRIGLLTSDEPQLLPPTRFSLLNDEGAMVANFPVHPTGASYHGRLFTFTSDHRLILPPQFDPNHQLDDPPGPLPVYDPRTGSRLPDISIPRHARILPQFRTPLAISADGQWIAFDMGFPHFETRILHIADETLRTLVHDPGETFGHTFSNDGRMLAFVVQEMNIDLAEHELRSAVPPLPATIDRELRRQAWIIKIHVMDTRTGRELTAIHGVPGNLLHLAFSPDDRHLVGFGGARANTDRGIERSFGYVWNWEVPARETARVLHAGDEAVKDVLVTSDGRRIITAGDDKTVRVWNADSGALLQQWTGHSQPIQCLAKGGDPRIVLSASDREVFEWNCETGKSRKLFDTGAATVAAAVAGHEQSPRVLHGVALHPTSGLAAFAYGYGGSCVELFELADKRPRFKIDDVAQLPAFSPDGKLLAIPYQFDQHGELKIVDVANGRLIHHWKSESLGYVLRSGWGYLRAAFSPDSRYVAAVGNIGGADLYDVRSGRLVHRFRGHGTTVWDVDFTADGSRLATSGYADKTVKLWSVDSGEEVHTLRGHTGDVTGLAFSPDGTRLVTADSQGHVRIWEGEKVSGLFSGELSADKIPGSEGPNVQTKRVGFNTP